MRGARAVLGGAGTVLLVLDVSNRLTAAAVYHGGWAHTWQLSTERERTPDEFGLLLDALLRRAGLDPDDLAGAVIGSVVPAVTATICGACQRYFGISPLVVGPGIRTGVRIRTENPREVGPDRIANVLAAFRRHGGPAIVVDLSSATSFDAVSPEGEYLGSAIAPGVGMAADALTHRTAQLRAVDLARPDRVIGRTSAAAIQSGVVYGFAALVDGVVVRMTSELGGAATVIATGPYAELIQPASSTIDAVEPDLTLEGLRLIWEMNGAVVKERA